MTVANKDLVVSAINAMPVGDIALLHQLAGLPLTSPTPTSTELTAIRTLIHNHSPAAGAGAVKKFGNISFGGQLWGTNVANDSVLNSAEVLAIRDAAVARRTALRDEASRTITTAMGAASTPGLLTALAAVAAATGPADIRTALNTHKAVLGNLDIPTGEALITDAQTDTIKTAALQRYQALNNSSITDAITAITLTDTAKLVPLATIANAGGAGAPPAAAAVKGLLETHSAALGLTVNFTGPPTALTDLQLDAIYGRIVAKQRELNQAKIEGIINGISAPGTTTELAALAAVASAGTDDATRDALHAQQATFGVDFTGHTTAGDEFVLDNTQATAIRTAAAAKQAALQATAAAAAAKTATTVAKNETDIKAAIPSIGAPKLLEALAQVADGATDDDTAKAIRTQLNTDRANLGGVDLSAGLDNETLLTNQAAKEIRLLAIQRRNELLITEVINKAGDAQADILKAIANARAGNVRDAISRAGIFGVNLSKPTTGAPERLSDSQALAIQTLALQRYNELKLAEAIRNTQYPSFLDEIVKASDDATRRAALHGKAHFGNISIQPAAAAAGAPTPPLPTDLLSNEALQRLQEQAKLRQTQLKTLQTRATEFFIEETSLLGFVEERVEAGGKASALTSAAAVASRVTGQISSPDPAKVVCKGKELKPGDVIEARMLFDKASTGASKDITGRLVQDHTGKVSDLTDQGDFRHLTDDQKALLAVKQAQMLLVQYPGKGEIILRGSDPAQAARVYAAILYLKEAHPSLKDVKVVSYVTDMPTPGYMTSRYVKQHLPEAHISRGTLDAVKTQVGAVITGRKEREAKIARYEQDIAQLEKDLKRNPLATYTPPGHTKSYTIDELRQLLKDARVHEDAEVKLDTTRGAPAFRRTP
jgi:hypothetical protein